MLHGGPGLTGLSPAVKHCLCTPDHSQEPPLISIQDIPDVDPRELITNLESLEEDEHPSLQLRQQLGAHLLEAGIDPDLLGNSTVNQVVI